MVLLKLETVLYLYVLLKKPTTNKTKPTKQKTTTTKNPKQKTPKHKPNKIQNNFYSSRCWQTGCSWRYFVKWDLWKYCTWITTAVGQAAWSLYTCYEVLWHLPPPNFYSSKDALSSVQHKKAEYHGATPACSSSELLQRTQGTTEGWSKGPRHMGTLIISRWFCGRTTSAPLYARLLYTQTHFPYTLLQAQTIYGCAKHKIMLTGFIIWSSTFWTTEKRLQRNCIQMWSEQCCLPPLLCLLPLCPRDAQIRGKPFGRACSLRCPPPARAATGTAPQSRVLL